MLHVSRSRTQRDIHRQVRQVNQRKHASLTAERTRSRSALTANTMALSWLFPKDSAQPTASTSTPAPSTPAPAGALPVDHTAPPRSIFDEVDGEQMPGRDKDGRRKLPPVALYVSGAAVSESLRTRRASSHLVSLSSAAHSHLNGSGSGNSGT